MEEDPSSLEDAGTVLRQDPDAGAQGAKALPSS